ncbi:hypothetical protein CANCADRAFT_17237, partial [Tortispora caseinolytica NRRL Y-17796]
PMALFKVRALFPYESDHDEDLHFEKGAIIEVTAIEDEDWYQGSIGDRSGLFPRNFV